MVVAFETSMDVCAFGFIGASTAYILELGLISNYFSVNRHMLVEQFPGRLQDHREAVA